MERVGRQAGRCVRGMQMGVVGWHGGAGWWRGVAWIGVVWHGLGWHGVDWGGMVWIGVAWHGLGWHGVDWGGMAWIGVAWHGLGWERDTGGTWGQGASMRGKTCQAVEINVSVGHGGHWDVMEAR